MDCSLFNRPCSLPTEDANLETPTIVNLSQDDTSISFNLIFPYPYGFVEVACVSDGEPVGHKTFAYPSNFILFDIPSASGSSVLIQFRWFSDPSSIATSSRWVKESLFFYAGLEGVEDVVHDGIAVSHDNDSVTYFKTERWLLYDDGEDAGILAEDGIYLGF